MILCITGSDMQVYAFTFSPGMFLREGDILGLRLATRKRGKIEYFLLEFKP
nr:hypothetical protein Q903MT_gene2106 [Picea sitchensis]